MTTEQLAAVQQQAQQQWGIGKVQFAETLLCTSYDTYARWTGPRSAKMPGTVKPALALISYALRHNWSLDELKYLIYKQ